MNLNENFKKTIADLVESELSINEGDKPIRKKNNILLIKFLK